LGAFGGLVFDGLGLVKHQRVPGHGSKTFGLLLQQAVAGYQSHAVEFPIRARPFTRPALAWSPTALAWVGWSLLRREPWLKTRVPPSATSSRTVADIANLRQMREPGGFRAILIW
jgi:hypothetical protein